MIYVGVCYYSSLDSMNMNQNLAIFQFGGFLILWYIETNS